MGAKLSFLVVFVLLLTGNHSLNWMAAGNFTPDNMTVIFDRINSINPSIASTALGAFAADFSDYLTKLWDPAWNVVIVQVYSTLHGDSVVRGYAFNSHWFWLNGYQLSSGVEISFVLWKDYNCARWVTYDGSASPFPASTTYGTSQSSLNGIYVQTSTDDIWGDAGTYLGKVLKASSQFNQDPFAYTIVMSQYAIYYYFKACAKHYAVRSQTIFLNGKGYIGTTLLLQMR